MKLSFALIPAWLLVTAFHVTAQDKCRIEGKVVNSATGQPMSRAWVTLTAARASMSAPINSAQWSAAVDSSGTFQFDGLEAGSYELSAQRDGFDLESPAPGEAPNITLTPGSTKSGVILRLLPLGAIAGRITGDDGDPIRSVHVDLAIYRWGSNGPMPDVRGSADTNDLGEYRIYDIHPGRYYLRAVPRLANYTPMGLSGETFAPEFYPGTFERASAVQVEVHAGDQIRGLDMVLRRFQGGSIRGRVVTPPGVPSTARISVSAEPISSDGAVNANLNASTDPQGNFLIRAVPPGLYTLRAHAAVDQMEYDTGMLLQVGSSDISGVSLRLAAPMEVKGVVRFEGAPSIRLSQVRIYLASVIPRLRGAQATARDDGAFTLKNVSATAYTVVVAAAAVSSAPLPVLYVKSVSCGNSAAVDTGVDFSGGSPCDLSIVVSAAGGRIEGTAALDADEKTGTFWVTMVPDGRSREYPRSRSVKVDPSGAFQISNIPPGSYRLLAWAAGTVDVDTATYDPDFTKRYENQGQSVRVAETSTQSVALKIVKVER